MGKTHKRVQDTRQPLGKCTHLDSLCSGATTTHAADETYTSEAKTGTGTTTNPATTIASTISATATALAEQRFRNASTNQSTA